MFDKDDVEAAVRDGVIDRGDADRLLAYLERRRGSFPGTQLTLANVLWLTGAAVIFLSLFYLTIGLDRKAPVTAINDYIQFAIASGLYAVACLLIAIRIMQNSAWRELAGLLMLASCFSFGASLYGLFEGVETIRAAVYSQWSLLLLPGVFIGVFGLVRMKYLPLWLPVLAGLYLFVVDFLMLGAAPDSRSELQIHIMAGCGVILTGYFLDLVAKRNHGFWFNKAGLLLLSVSASSYFVIFKYEVATEFLAGAVGLILFSVFQRRETGVRVGLLGVLGYITFVFSSSQSDYRALQLGAAGFLIVVAAIAIMRSGAHDRFFPAVLDKLRPRHRDDPITFGFIE